MIDGARARGLDVTTEVYPYTAASTYLQSAMFEPGWQERFAVGFNDVQWAATGERLTEESFARYRKQGGLVVIHMIPEESVRAALVHPGVLVGSDGVPLTNGGGHPRGVGTYARILGRYVREEKVLDLMTALRKITVMVAQRLEPFVPAMRSKGRLAVGADADMTVFDAARVIDRATYEKPGAVLRRHPPRARRRHLHRRTMTCARRDAGPRHSRCATLIAQPVAIRQWAITNRESSNPRTGLRIQRFSDSRLVIRTSDQLGGNGSGRSRVVVAVSPCRARLARRTGRSTARRSAPTLSGRRPRFGRRAAA